MTLNGCVLWMIFESLPLEWINATKSRAIYDVIME